MNKKGQTLKEIFVQALECYKQKNFKDAEIFCYKILSIDSNHVESISLLATISAFSGNYIKAKELLIKAIEIEPHNASITHNLGTAFKELGNLEEAMNYYRKVLQISPKHTNAHYNIGLIFYKPSQRYVDPELIFEWIQELPVGVKKVGVFVRITVAQPANCEIRRRT